MRFRKTLTLLALAMGLVFALSAWAQQKPFTRDQVQGLVRDGLGDESGAKLIAGGGDIVLPCRRLGGPSVARAPGGHAYMQDNVCTRDLGDTQSRVLILQWDA
jgi:hypothetical protein